MKKRVFAIWVLFFVVILVNASLFGANGDMGLGSEPLTDGSESYPYLIEDFNDFNDFASNGGYWASGIYTRLECDLDLDPNLAGRDAYSEAVIAPSTSSYYSGFEGVAFSGCFDGNGHVIHNLTIYQTSRYKGYFGLFGQIAGENAEVKNLDLENINIHGNNYDSGYIGGLCGENAGGEISNCHITGIIQIDNYTSYIGGICGINYGYINNCHTTEEIILEGNSEHVGSLCGENTSNAVINCCSGNSNITCTYSYKLGGLCGTNSGTLSQCYTNSNITGNYSIGGLCGENGSRVNHDSLIINCYAIGNIIGSSDLGGICGKNSANIINCYSTSAVDGYSDTGGLCGDTYYGEVVNCYFYMFNSIDNNIGTSLDNSEIQDANSYVGFDFMDNSNDGNDEIWDIVNGHCPKLAWQSDDGPLVPVIETTLIGSGNSNDPYQINSYEDFMEFRNNTSLRIGYYILNTNIDLSSEVFNTAVINRYFAGNFDGNNNVISNVTIDTNGIKANFLGLFNTIGSSVSNLGVENININDISSSNYIGGLCGNTFGSIINCYTTGEINCESGSDYIGGLCGYNYRTITNCNTDMIIKGSEYLGGLCGYNGAYTINNCYATGNISGDKYSNCLGGLSGYNHGYITNSYATVTIDSGHTSSNIGGLCGHNVYGEISNCYASGIVNSDNYSYNLGGLCGYNESPYTNISRCYATGAVISGDGSYKLGGLCGNNQGSINNCYASNQIISGDNSYHLGGLSGFNIGTATNCYANSSVTGGYNCYNLGGFCGENYNNITNSYSTGNIKSKYGSYNIGGLCGLNNIYYGTLTNCYFCALAGPDNNYGIALGNQQFLDANNFTGFDFVEDINDGNDGYWSIVNGHCPKLSWQENDGPTLLNITTLVGSGNLHDPLQINDYNDFNEFRDNNDLNAGYYILNTDINLSEETFTTSVIDRYFAGHFNGNGHTINNINIDTEETDKDYLGLFSYICASVNNLNITNVNITSSNSSQYIGGLCGYNNGSITKCFTTNIVTNGDNLQYIGGLCGYNSKGSINNCHSTGITNMGNNSKYIGGLCGHNIEDSIIINCYTTGAVISGQNSKFVGNLCGCNEESLINNCYAKGTVTNGYDSSDIGCLCGLNRRGNITNCYATGVITDRENSSYIGELCGFNLDGSISSSFWDSEASGLSTGYIQSYYYPGIITNVVSKTTAQMQTLSTFVDGGWDFVGEEINGSNDIWRMCDDGVDYPKLWWEFADGDFVCGDGVNLLDFAVLAQSWDISDCEDGYNYKCDLNDDEIINFDDLAIFIDNWLKRDE